MTTKSPAPASSVPQPVAATPIAFVNAIVHAYVQRGMSPAHALATAQIPPHSLQNPQARITALQMEALSAAAMRELDDEALGWFSRRLPWGSYGMLARASISSPTLGIALRRWCRHHALIADDIGLHLDAVDGTATLSLSEHRDLGMLREFCTVSVLRNAPRARLLVHRFPASTAGRVLSVPAAAACHGLSAALRGGSALRRFPGPCCGSTPDTSTCPCSATRTRCG